MFEVVYDPHFSFNKQFWFFETNLAQKGYFYTKIERQTSPLNSPYLSYTKYQISAKTYNFSIFGSNFPKKCISSRKQMQ